MNQQTFIFIHGAGMQGGVWHDLSALLSSASVTFDLPGHGAGNEVSFETIDEMAKWVAKKAAGYKYPVLVGHSMGALVAIAAAASLPLQALILIGANAKMPVNPQLLQMAVEKPDEAAAMILKWGIAKTAVPSVREQFVPLMCQKVSGVLARDLAACNDWQGTEEAAGKIKIPVLVISGSEDKMTPVAGGVELSRLFANGKSVVLPDTGHMAMVENPQGCARSIFDFMKENTLTDRQ